MTALSIAEAERRTAVKPQVSVVGPADSEADAELATVTDLASVAAGKDATSQEIPGAAGVSRHAGVSRGTAIAPRAGVSRAAVAPRAAAAGRRPAAVRAAVPGRAATSARAAIRPGIAGRAGAAIPARAAAPARTAAAPGPVRLTARGRRVVAGLAVIAGAVAACLLSLTLAGGAAAASHGPAREGWPAARQIVVEPGQTLWSIASAAEPGADTRAVIEQIIAANRLPGDTIEPGEALWVPGD